MALWRFAGECPPITRPVPDSETISIGGVNPWRFSWSSLVDDPQIVVPDPRNSSRYLHVSVSRLKTPEGQIVTFAAHMSSDHWAFFVPASEGDKDAFPIRFAQYEGHWRKTQDEASDLPWPVPQPTWAGRSEFLSALAKAEEAAEETRYRGASMCRLCRRPNGSSAFCLGIWEWPSGFKHYIAAHQVRPTPAFEAFILDGFSD